ncbi:MAG TPA: MoaD/ThiS family protein [Planctomycetaceae bacterium]|nr:MoaD/ThiS family protein [Planctomycetaceae bacterium]
MSIRVCYVAQARKVAGTSDDVVPWRAGLTLSALLDELAAARGPDFRTFLFRSDGRLQATLLIAINDQPVPRGSAETTILNDGDVVTMIPPVAGG